MCNQMNSFAPAWVIGDSVRISRYRDEKSFVDASLLRSARLQINVLCTGFTTDSATRLLACEISRNY